jgi:hypothetical protein
VLGAGKTEGLDSAIVFVKLSFTKSLLITEHSHVMLNTISTLLLQNFMLSLSGQTFNSNGTFLELEAFSP